MTTIAENPLDQHKNWLREALHGIQLDFADHVFQALKEREEAFFLEEEKGLRFSSIIPRFTPLMADLKSRYRSAFPLKGEYQNYILPIRDSIDTLHYLRGDHWQDSIAALIEFEAAKLDSKKTDIGWSQAGILFYEIVKGKEIPSYNLSNTSVYLQIHIIPSYQARLSLTVRYIQESLHAIARIIKCKCPDVEGVVGRSWLLDRRLASLLNFHIYQRVDLYHSWFMWGQLINQYGQINKERVDYLFQNDHLPFQVAYGVIPRDIFLERYSTTQEC